MKLISWNVNGLRSILRKDFLQITQQYCADWWCLQEIKLSSHQVPVEVREHFPYQAMAHSSLPKQSAYSGVAILGKHAPDSLFLVGLGEKRFDEEGRVVVLVEKDFFLINAYYPHGRDDHSRVPYKLEFSRSVLNYAKKLMDDWKRPAVLCGDFNTAHHQIDLKNPKTNLNTSGFLPEERVFLDELEEAGFVDAFRALHPGEEYHYTWWSYRQRSRERNVGWRLDYFWVHQDLFPKIKDCKHLTEVMGSDHCPVVLEF